MFQANSDQLYVVQSTIVLTASVSNIPWFDEVRMILMIVNKLCFNVAVTLKIDQN